jgi:diguanylate cyclase (GGDEF)-like protein
MQHTIFILGTSRDQCAELRDILQEKIADKIITTSVGDPIPKVSDSDTVIISAEERSSGVLYRHLLERLDEQVQRAQVLGELIRLSSSTLRLEDILDRVVSKSTEVLGDTALIVLNADAKLQLEAAFSKDPERLTRLLITAINVSAQSIAASLLRPVLDSSESVLVPSLHQARIPPELQSIVDQYGLMSLAATPIRTRDRVLGAFVSISTAPKTLSKQDLATATELADFTAMVVENARLFAELQRSATTDPLTGVYNTRFFHEVLSREASRSQRYSTPLALLMIDVDGFKPVNDTFGHLVGDKVLTQVGHIISSAVRNTDLVFRCGGDEFGVVLPGTTSDGAVRVAEKILQRVRSERVLETLGYTGSLTVSIGVSEYQKGTPFEAMVADADKALYASKRSSKDCVRVHRASA